MSNAPALGTTGPQFEGFDVHTGPFSIESEATFALRSKTDLPSSFARRSPATGGTLIPQRLSHLLVRRQCLMQVAFFEDLVQVSFSDIHIVFYFIIAFRNSPNVPLVIGRGVALFHDKVLLSASILLHLLKLSQRSHDLRSVEVSSSPRGDLVFLRNSQIRLSEHHVPFHYTGQVNALIFEFLEALVHPYDVILKALLALPALPVDGLLEGTGHRRLKVRLVMLPQLVKDCLNSSFALDLVQRYFIRCSSC